MENIPAKYQKKFNSAHEGYAVLLEEVEELKETIFFEEKKIYNSFHYIKDESQRKALTKEVLSQRIKDESVQVAAMACRIIQELC